jgi:hypothetical protein
VGAPTLRSAPDHLGRPRGIKHWEAIGLDETYTNGVVIRFFLVEDEANFVRYSTDKNVKDAGECQAYTNKYQTFYYYFPIKINRS